jgi:hypothetical protein
MQRCKNTIDNRIPNVRDSGEDLKVENYNTNQ